MLKPGKHLVLGNIACAEGALKVGCRFFAGYPITPANEISEYLATEMPKIGGFFLQMEDEIASIGAVIGASWAGAKAMTATSGPGFSLMQENISYAHQTETPCVIVDVQRSGPSTGQSTMPSQQDIYQARYGAHGDYEAVALAPWSVQEFFDLTVRSFNISERFRAPVLLMADGVIGHIKEKLIVPEDVEIVDRRKTSTSDSQPFGTEDPCGVPEMPTLGGGRRLLITGSSHRSTGLRDDSPKMQSSIINRIRQKILRAEPDIRDVVGVDIDDADVAVVSFGAPARPSYGAVKRARADGIKAGLLRLKTVWPFPDVEVKKLAEEAKAILVVEMNAGKIVREVGRAARGCSDVVSVPKVGGLLHSVDEIHKLIVRADG